MYQSKKRCPLTKQSCASDCAWFDDIADCGMLSAVKDLSLAMQELTARRRQSQTIDNGQRFNKAPSDLN
jgi:hypothetical protein